MKTLTWKGPRNPITDYTSMLYDSNGDAVGLGDQGKFSAADAEALSAHHVLVDAKGKEVEPGEPDEPAEPQLTTTTSE